MKQTFCKVLTVFLLVGWMTIIFVFSAQQAEESGEMSGSVAIQILDGAERVFGIDLSELDRFHMVEKLSYPIRKSAHMTEYAILALLAFLFWQAFGIERKRAYRFSFFLAVVYAATDELHQIFVPGREGKFTDVCIDAVGALIGLWILWMVQRKMCRLRGKDCEKQTLPLQ